MHSCRVILKAGPKPLTVAFRLKDAEEADEDELAPCIVMIDLHQLLRKVCLICLCQARLGECVQVNAAKAACMPLVPLQ